MIYPAAMAFGTLATVATVVATHRVCIKRLQECSNRTRSDETSPGETTLVPPSVGKHSFSQKPIFLSPIQILGRFFEQKTTITSTSDGYKLDSPTSDCHCRFATSVYGYRLLVDGEEKHILMSSQNKYLQHGVNNFLIHLSPRISKMGAYFTSLNSHTPEAIDKARQYKDNSFIFMTYLKGNRQAVPFAELNLDNTYMDHSCYQETKLPSLYHSGDVLKMKTRHNTYVFGMVLENSVNPQIISLSGPDGVVYTKSLESFRDEGIIPYNKIDFPFSTKFNEDKSLLEGFPIQRICEYQLLPSDKKLIKKSSDGEIIQNCFSFAAFYYNGIIPKQHIDSNLFSCLKSKQRTDSFNKGDILYLSNSRDSNDYHFAVTLEEGENPRCIAQTNNLGEIGIQRIADMPSSCDKVSTITFIDNYIYKPNKKAKSNIN